jgi:hypothetical protein
MISGCAGIPSIWLNTTMASSAGTDLEFDQDY